MFARLLLLFGSSIVILAAAPLLVAQEQTEQGPPPLYCSAAGTYCAQNLALHMHDSEDPADWTEDVQILQRKQDGTYLHLRTLTIDPSGDDPLLSDDGRTLVVFRYGEFDGHGRIAILRTDGTVAATVRLDDVVDAWDLLAWTDVAPRWSIRPAETGEERLVLSLLSTMAGGYDGPRGEIEISLEDGRLLTPKRAIYPPPRAFARAALEDVPAARLGGWTEPRCPAGPMLFGERGLLPIDAQAFLAAAVETPVPEYPVVAVKARITGTVYAELVVDEGGRVACARVNGLPFGIEAVAEQAVLRWRFHPFEWKGAPVRAIGRVALQFGRVEHEEWARISAGR
jgi:hypothetical protein